MKLNKFLLSLLIVPALTFSGCSDYEDSEVASPQANENALGTNFTKDATTVLVNPKEDSFVLTLNRVNTKAAATVPVTVVSCSEVTPGVKFCDLPTVFAFAAGEAIATVKLKYNPACKFQEKYSMVLSIGDGKDHIYAGGTSSTKVSFSIDYDWAELGKPVILENGWYDAGILAPVEWAADYEDKATGNMLFRVADLYGGAKIAADVVLKKDEMADKYTAVVPGDLQFFLDGDFNPVGILSNNGYDPTKVNTGVLQNEKTGNYFLMNFKSVIKGLGENTYIFTYDVFYEVGGAVVNVKENVISILDFDFKASME